MLMGPLVNHLEKGLKSSSEHPYEYFCHRFNSSSAESETPSLNSPWEYVDQRMI